MALTRSFLTALGAVALGVTLVAQWPAYPVSKVPRGPDGRPVMTGPTPRTADGKPDLSGVWNYAGVLGFRAQLMTVLPGTTACYRCVFEEAPPPGDAPSCNEAGVLGPVPALVAALQAAEALRLLTGSAPSYADRLLSLDLREGRWRTVPLARNPRCPTCAAAAPVERSVTA